MLKEQAMNTVYTIVSFFTIFMIDNIVQLFDRYVFYRSRFFNSINSKKRDNIVKKEDERRWYFIHTLVNCFIFITTFKDLIAVLKDPMNAVGTEFNTIPMCTSISLHLYHIYRLRKDMDVIDWAHHIINALAVGITTLFYYKGLLVNYIIFFICGFPGSIDYACLTLYRYGLINKMTEKRFNTFQNNWLRSPGIIVGCFIGYLNHIYRYNELQHNNIILILLLIFNFGNCVYFAERVTKNYGYHIGLRAVNKHLDKY